jgi:predicted esterase
MMLRRRTLSLLSLLSLSALAACGSEDTSSTRGDDNEGGDQADTGTTDTGGEDVITLDTGSGDTGSADTGGSDTGSDDTGTIDIDEPDFAYGAPDEPAAYSGGACPTLDEGDNDIDSDGAARTIKLFLPAEPSGAPVLFMWHGLGDSADNFASSLGAQQLAEQEGAIVVVPSMGTAATLLGQPIWSFPNALSQVSEPDLTLFDDVLSCLDEQFDIDNRRVYSAGFSAGALFTSYLTIERAGYLAATVIWSGGTSGQLTFRYASSDYPLPVYLSHGGSSDVFSGVLRFDQMVEDMSAGLAADDHFTVLCTHTQGHTVTENIVLGGYDFLFRHQWGTGTSPLADDGLPRSYASTCEVVTP